MTKFISTKTYGNDRGLSCCFRQWRATHSHCSLLHGYSIGIKLIFESETLDEKNWVMDFGGLKAFKDWAEYMFDHTLVVAEDDPQLQQLLLLDKSLHADGIADIRIVGGVGCERFAELAYKTMDDILKQFQSTGSWEFYDTTISEYKKYATRYTISKGIKLRSVEVFEHAGNSAIYEGL